MKTIKKLGFFFFLLASFISHSQEELSVDMKNVIQLLQIDLENVDRDLSIEKPMRYLPEMMAYAVLEKVGESDYAEEGHHTYKCHVVLYNASDKIITNRYVIENLESDAIRLSKVSLDFAPYMVQSNKRAFGLRISYSGASRVNPYEEEKLTLFVQEKDKLVPVLKDFTSYLSTGDWDTNCAGEFNEKRAVFVLEPTSSNGFFDMKVNYKAIKTINKPVSGDCEGTETATKSSAKLVYVNGTYQVKK
jgi:hypothetical protein